MATSITPSVLSINKGDSISVSVEDVTTDVISVKFNGGDKVFQGILLQVDPSYNQYGINPDRVRGAPFWSPLTTPTAGINLKTIPCSTERYSYKLEGQPSTLSVFQPEAIKRSNRNQPAPQLSRILRPRRFVCRKCKKAYHVEENGIELSSTALSFLAGRSNADSSAVTSDHENLTVSSSVCGNGKSIRRNHFTSSTNTENAQSIRHVTPSIIPKLTEDYGLSGRESEGDSNSDDTVTPKSKRAQVKEKKPVGLTVTAADKSVLQTKRKIHSSDPVHRPKKIKRISSSESRNTSMPKEITTVPLDSTECEAVHTQSTVDHPIPSVDSHSHKPVHSIQSAPVKSDDVQIRKNRIKAQYVSVATPFRFPPSRSSKPNLLSISQLAGTSREKTNVVQKRVVRPEEHRTDDNKKEPLKIADSTSSRKKPHGSKSFSKKQCSNVDSLSLSARPHSRTRIGQYDEAQCLDSTSMQSVPEVPVTSRQTVNPSDSSFSPLNSKSVKNEDSLTRRTSEVLDMTSVAHSSDSGPHITDHSETNHDLVCPVQQSNDNTNISVISNCGRLKAIDYEKPKNRWIREARARRSQEERTSTITSMPLSVVSTNSNASVCSAASSLHPCESDNNIPTPVSPLTISRLRSRSSDLGVHANTSAVDSPSKVGNAPKRRSGPITANNSDVTTMVNLIAPESNEEALQAADAQLPSTHLSPRSTPLSDSSGTCLPVLKIKINRNRPVSTTDASKSAEYEVVEMQVSGYDAGCAVSVGSDVAPAAKNDSVAVTPTDTPSGIFESKLEHSVNGSWASSPSPSVSSSRKGMPFTDSVAPGLPVKRCKLSDGVVFRVGDLVWSKLSGWPSWPAQITSIHRITSDELECDGESDMPNGTQLKSSPVPASKRPSYTACLHWFAWHQVSYIHCDKLFHFLQHYKRFDNKKKRGIFRQAVNEALQKSKEKLAAPPSSAEDSFDEQEDDIVANLTSAVPEAVDICSSVAPSSCIHTVSEALLDPHVPAIVEPVEIKHVAESPSLQDSSSFPPPLPALHVRRGPPFRGRVRGLRGRRGSSSQIDAPVRTSPRNLSTLLPTEIHNEFSFDFRSDNTPALPARTNTTSRGRGRGRARGRARGRGRMFTVINKRTFTVQPDTDCLSIVTPPESIGTLKIVLSKTKVRQSVSVKRKKDITIKKVGKTNGSVSASLMKQPDSVADKQYDSPSDTRQLQTNVALDSCNDLPVSGENIGESTAVPQSSYGDPSADLLSQFPQVFPDLRASGILSDTVDIPTFSEDESEEEDAGRLIIDPDVMASVNASGSSARETTTSLTQLNRTDPTESRKDCYNVQYFSAVRSLNAPQSHLSASFDTTSCVDRLSNPMLPSSSCVSGSNTQSTVPVRVGFPTSHLAGPTAPCRSIPAVQPLTQLLHPSPHQLLTRDTFDPTHRLTYFQPSSHKSVPVTASNSNVPYMTTDYTTL